MAECAKRIFSISAAHSHRHQRRGLDGHGYHSHLVHLAEKSLGGENAAWGIRRLQRLVLERAAHLGKSASKLAVRCYSKSGFTCIHPIHYKATDERGT